MQFNMKILLSELSAVDFESAGWVRHGWRRSGLLLHCLICLQLFITVFCHLIGII